MESEGNLGIIDFKIGGLLKILEIMIKIDMGM